jgi:hypothetical protein
LQRKRARGGAPLCPRRRLLSRLSSFDMAENESYDEPIDGERGDRRRRERVKKPPVPVLPDGTWVRIGDSCRSSTLQGQVGTVVAWGRQVDVLLRGSGGSEGAVRKINPTDLIALSEEPELTAAEEQVTGEEAVPTRTSSRAPTHAPTRGVRSTPLGKPAGAVTDEVRAPPLASHRPVQLARLESRKPLTHPRRGRHPPRPHRSGQRLGAGGAAVPRVRRRRSSRLSWAAGCVSPDYP